LVSITLHPLQLGKPRGSHHNPNGDKWCLNGNISSFTNSCYGYKRPGIWSTLNRKLLFLLPSLSTTTHNEILNRCRTIRALPPALPRSRRDSLIRPSVRCSGNVPRHRRVFRWFLRHAHAQLYHLWFPPKIPLHRRLRRHKRLELTQMRLLSSAHVHRRRFGKEAERQHLGD
jgi:hypothetical protein